MFLHRCSCHLTRRAALAGGTAPYLMERFRFLAATTAKPGRFPNGVEAALQGF